jgi:transposase
MWTTENRGRYDRSKLRYPSDLTDEEWWLVGPLIPAAKRGGNKRTIDVREVVNGIMYILSTGCQWAALPKDLPPRSTVNSYFLRCVRSPYSLRATAARGSGITAAIRNIEGA